MLDFAQCERLVSNARDRQSKPFANNTRVEKRDEDTYALRLHSTDVATFHRDGRITLNSGGYRTVTTLDRIRYVTSHLTSERGDWFVQSTPDPTDPEPPHGHRTIPKPFHALDPGPEPVKPEEGCIAGAESWREWDEEVLVTKYELADGRVDEADIARSYERGGDLFVGYRIAHKRELTAFGEHRYNWSHLPNYVKPPALAADETFKYEQCPHCKLFEDQRDAWKSAMHGGGWGRNRTHGYAKMVELLETYGSREVWQDAYLTEFRMVRDQRRAYKAWVQRNRVPFEDGMTITADGYAPRPDPKAVKRAERAQKRTEKQRERINKFVTEAVDALANGLPMPGPGDCWGCALRDVNDPSAEWSDNHLEDHIRERYFVPSMYVNALRDSGYRDAGIYIFLAMDPDANTMGGEGISRDTVTRALRKYLTKRLVPQLAAVR